MRRPGRDRPVAGSDPPDGAWSAFVQRFHEDRPGITEDTLGRARAAGTDPYRWLLEPLPAAARVLDLACGSGPVLARAGRAGWLGVDRSAAELARARRAGASDLVRAEGHRLPVPDASVGGVVCSMGIMVLQPVGAVMDEIGRVLRPGGTVVLLVPGGRPLRPSDLLYWGVLLATLRRTHFAYPNGRALGDLPRIAGRAGLRVVDDRRRRFELPLRNAADGRLLVRSLYLPGTDGRRVEAAATRAARWRGVGIGIPLRRITLRRATALAHAGDRPDVGTGAP